MSYNPHITAARREAKSRARATGASHQSMLEQVAREAGASSWSDFLSSPMPLGQATSPDDDDVAPEVRATGSKKSWRRWCVAGIAALAALISIATAHLLIDLNASYGYRNQQERNAAPKMVFAGLPGFLGDRSYPYFVRRTTTDGLESAVMFLDVRTTPLDPARLHARVMAMLTSGQSNQEWTYLGHGLSRFVFSVDCSADLVTLRRREIADSYTGPAIAAYSTPTSRPISLSPDAMRRLCDRSALDARGRTDEASSVTS